MKVAIAVVVALVLGVVLVPGVVQGQILRWDNGQPIPGTEFVDPVRYAAGDLRGYGFSNLDLSYADLHGMDMSGTSWITNRGSKIDLRDTNWSVYSGSRFSLRISCSERNKWRGSSNNERNPNFK